MKNLSEFITSYEAWLSSPEGRYVYGRICILLQEVLKLHRGERLLEVGCKTGHHLSFFRNRGCLVTGVETSRTVLDAARERVGHHAVLHRAEYEDLPFSDNEFDVVTLIGSLESARDPHRAMSEAIRICRGRVCIGLFNWSSLAAHRLKASGTPRDTDRTLGILGTIRMARSILSGVPVHWGSVIYFPLWCYPHAEDLESRLPMIRNPFGSFAALSFPVTYTHRTLQEPLRPEVPAASLRESGRVAGTACKTKGGLL